MKHSRTIKATNERSEELRPGSVGRMAYVFTRGPLPRGWGEWKHWRPHLARLGLAALALAAGLFASTVWAQQGGFSVTATTPADGAAHVPVEANIIVKFSAPVDPASLTPQTVQVNDQPLAELENGGLAFPEADSAVVLFRMKANAVYQITLAGSVKDTQGNALGQPFSWRFASVSRIGQPGAPVKAFARYPRHNVYGVPVNAPITLSFTTELEGKSLSGESVRVVPSSGGPAVPGKVAVEGRRVIFRPEAPLAPNQTYEVEIAAGVKSKAGMTSERSSSWQFTTGDGPREGPVITECWYESYPEATGLRLVFHVAAENLLKEGAKADKAARATRMPGANGVLQAAVVSLAGLVAQQPLSTPTSRQAKDMPVTNGGPETVVYAAYTHGGGRGPGNSVAGYDGKDPGMELVNAAVAAALDGAGAVTLYDVGDLVEHGDEVRGDGVYSGRLKLSPQFPTGPALIAFSILRPDGSRTSPETMSLYILPPPAAVESAGETQ